ncbi:unnamed protein product [Blepharisma stoltei]|uniref:Uncharacterized protein n=1 Tax=Blepharisma stoltei TaxID=1481888 RepID=A0AAU9JCY7_9CILI|nr:unnamed protein product [Blepharisma stoltei]
MSGNNVYPYERIAHLENNSYIYGEPIPFPSANISPVEDYDQSLHENNSNEEKSENFVEQETEDNRVILQESPYQESPNRFKDIESSIERQIVEKEAYWSRKSAEIRETWKQLQLNNIERSQSPPARRPLSNRNTSPGSSKHIRPASTRNKSKSTVKKSKYEHINNKYSKINTKSPYCRSTFSQEVRVMENQPYTYSKKKVKKSNTKKNLEEEMLDRIIKVVEKHSKLCPHLKSEVDQIRKETLKAKWR